MKNNSLSVLVADDEPVNLRVAAALLRRAGYEVTAVGGGAAALAAAKEFPFDLVLVDVRMPDVDGLAVARGLRTAGRTCRIVALTASAAPDDLAAWRAAGMDGYLLKPLDAGRLAELLETIAVGGGWPAPAGRGEGPALLDVAHLEDLATATGAKVFVASIAACVVSLEQSAAALRRAGDAVAVAGIAHRLRGTAGTFGLRALHAAAGTLEAEAKAGGRPLPVDLVLGLTEESIAALHGFTAHPPL